VDATSSAAPGATQPSSYWGQIRREKGSALQERIRQGPWLSKRGKHDAQNDRRSVKRIVAKGPKAGQRKEATFHGAKDLTTKGEDGE